MCDGQFKQWYISFADGQVCCFGRSKATPWESGRQKDKRGHDLPRYVYPNDRREAPCDSWRSWPRLAVPAVVLGTSPFLDLPGLKLFPELPTFGVNGIIRAFVPDLWFVATRLAWRENMAFVKRAGLITCNVVCWRRPMLRAGIIPMAMDAVPIPEICLHSSAVFCAYLAHYLGFDPVYCHGMDAARAGPMDHFYDRPIDIPQAPMERIAAATEQLRRESWVVFVRRIKELPPGRRGWRDEIILRLTPYRMFFDNAAAAVRIKESLI